MTNCGDSDVGLRSSQSQLPNEKAKGRGKDRTAPRSLGHQQDELDQYLAEPMVDIEHYEKEPLAWGSDLGAIALAYLVHPSGHGAKQGFINPNRRFVYWIRSAMRGLAPGVLGTDGLSGCFGYVNAMYFQREIGMVQCQYPTPPAGNKYHHASIFVVHYESATSFPILVLGVARYRVFLSATLVCSSAVYLQPISKHDIV